MSVLTLSKSEWRSLTELVTSPSEARVLPRAQALLWLDEGASIQEVATRLRISRQTVYNWMYRFRAQKQAPLPGRLTDGARSGRPATAQGLIDPLIEAVIEQSPREWGYRATVWTAALLRQYFDEVHHISVSRQSVSLALKRLRIGWKRPRHDLARQSPTWRQAKGGSNGDFGNAPGRSFSC